MPLALSAAHEVGLAVTAAAFIAFALASSFLFPRFRPNYPGGGMLAFVVVALVFFFGMLTAVETFGAEEGEAGGEHAAESATAENTTAATTTAETTTVETTTSTSATTSTAPATPAPKPQATNVKVDESEFKIALPSTNLKAGRIRFDVKNVGKLPHDLAIKQTGDKTELIQPGGSTTLTATLTPGTYELYCSVPGHEAAGMKVSVTVS